MTDLDALTALRAAATPGEVLPFADQEHCASDCCDWYPRLHVHGDPAEYQRLVPSLIEAARREAAAIAVLRAMTDHPWSFATDPDGDCFFCDNPCAGEDEQADHDAANPECPTTIARALLHDNAGTTEPAEGTE